VSYLVWRNYPNPEEDFHADPRRAWLQRFFYRATLVLVPLAAVGLLGGGARRRSAALLIAAQLVTIVVAAAFYFAEARHRVPYDPFLVIAGVSGGARIARRVYARLRPKLVRERTWHSKLAASNSMASDRS
jgi:uncharacterized membrane protein YfcA